VLTGRPKAALVLTADERQELESMAHRARTRPQLARRARIVLACADGADNKTVARRLEGLLDEPRPGIADASPMRRSKPWWCARSRGTPVGATHWSTRDMAKAATLSSATIHRIWQAFGLQPHRTETFKLAPDPLLIDKVRDIVGLYMHPPQHAIFLCVDEKPQIQALNRTAPLPPLQPGQAERRTHDATAPPRYLPR